MHGHQDVPVADGTTPIAATPPDLVAAQKQLKVLQWAIPALTGAIIVVSAKAGEQQRATNVAAGILHRITDSSSTARDNRRICAYAYNRWRSEVVGHMYATVRTYAAL